MPNSQSLLVALIATLALATVSVWLSRGDGQKPGFLGRFFLVALRVGIGWHFFIEATEKLHDASWSSEGYLRESTGPLAPHFRDIAGDRLIDALTVGEQNSFPAEFELRWNAYTDAFTEFYALDAGQALKAAQALKEAKEKVAPHLTTLPRKVRLITEADDAPPVFKNLTMPERLAILKQMNDRVLRIENEELARYGEEARQAWTDAKGDFRKWRGALERDWALLDRELKRRLRGVLYDALKARLDVPVPGGDGKTTYLARLEAGLKAAAAKRDKDLKDKKWAPAPKEEWEKVDLLQHKFDEEDLAVYRRVLADLHFARLGEKLGDQGQRIHQYAIDVKRPPATSYDLLPQPVPRPRYAWTQLDWGDLFVKWGLLAVGLCLILGLLTRTACVVGAAYLLLFYLAMPALPGWPPSPRAEGHYLYINKNIIEMLALLALATLRTGRWAGIDGFFALFRRDRPTPERTTLDAA